MILKQNNTTLIGTIDDFDFGLQDSDRAKNLHILGINTSLHTNFIESMLLQDVYNKKPFVYFEFTKDLTQEPGDILNFISNYNIDQVLYINPDNCKSLLDVEYSQIIGEKNSAKEFIKSSLIYKNVIDERIGVIFDFSEGNFVNIYEAKTFINNVLTIFNEILFERTKLPAYRKPLFTFYLDRFSKHYYSQYQWQNIIDQQTDTNACIVSTSSNIMDLEEETFEDLLKMYGNFIFSSLSNNDIARIDTFLKFTKESDLLKVKENEAIFKIFQNGERQRDFKAQLWLHKFQNYGYKNVILNK